ncbi:MAG TPA: phage minor head protein [Flavobacterium sp.]
MKKQNLPGKKIAVQAMKVGEDQTTHKCCGTHFPTAATPNKILGDLTNKLLSALWDNEDTIGIQGNIIVEEALELVSGLKSGYGTTIGYNTPDTLAYQMMEYNLFEFSASKTEARLAAMTELLLDQEKNEIRSYPDFEKAASEKAAVFNKEWLQTEYNLSVAVGQNSAAYLRFKAQKNDFPYVEYQTIGDSSVRNEHAKLNGMVFSLDDPQAMRLWPPNGYNCRCEMLQTNEKPKAVTSGKTAQEILNSEDAKWSTGQFNINRGDLKQVFTKKQFYSTNKGLPEKLNNMTFDKYDLSKWETFKSGLNKIELDETITPDNVKELFKKEKDTNYMGFKDYYGRKMILNETNFNKHITGKYLNKQENRHQMFPHIKAVLNSPDEVWYNTQDKQEGKFQSRYIKFYNDMMFIIDCEMKADGLQIKTWYQAKKEDLNLRKGLLIRNKAK